MKRRRGRLFVISSPSGGGKTTVVRQLLRRRTGLMRSVSVTTRARRQREREGRDYCFLTRGAFKRMRRSGALLESATVHGQAYGTPRQPIEQALAAGRDVVLSIDVQGAAQIRRILGERAVLVFLLPASIEELKRRLVHRKTEAPAAIRSRLRVARREMACAQWYDYAIVNETLDEAVRQLEAIVEAQRHAVLGLSRKH